MKTDDKLDAFRNKLKDWTNRDEVGTRFPKLSIEHFDPACPQCHSKELLVDAWPPNYSSFYAGGPFEEMSGTVKSICVHCSIHFTIEYSREVDRGVEKKKISYSTPVELVEVNGVLLTPNDVYCEKYKDEHGEYPRQEYG